MRNGDLIATGSDPCSVGEIVTVHLVGRDRRDIRARVVDSRPVLVDGFVRHRIRLAIADRPAKPIELAKADDVSEAQ